MSSAIIMEARLHDRWEGGEPWSEASPLPPQQFLQLGEVRRHAAGLVARQPSPAWAMLTRR
jgi:hypothetical protein